MRVDERNYLTKTIFSEAMVETSSDFIIVLYDLCEMTNLKLLLDIDPIYKWEYDNWHLSWVDNVNFINKKMADLSPSDYDEIYHSYTKILEYFLSDDAVASLYQMGDEDQLGWQIYKELEEKRQSTMRLKNISKLKGITT